MAADGGVVAKDFILDHRLSAPHRIEEVGLMIRNGIVARGRSERLHFFLRAEIERRREGIFFAPFLEVLLAQFRGPAVDRIALWLRTSVLWFKCHRRVLDGHGSFGAVKRQKTSGVIVQVAAKDHAEVGVIVESLDQVRKITAVFPAEKAAGGLGAVRDLVRAGDEMNPRNQVHKEVARQAFAIMSKAAPTEEAHGIKGALGGTVQKS